MLTSKILFLCLLTLTVAFVLPFAHAQTTSIGGLKYPAQAQGGIDPLLVEAAVSYQGVTNGYSLIVGIVDPSTSPQQVIPGIPTSAPDPCTGQLILAALCVMSPQASSGSEHLAFRIGGILDKARNPGPWNLEIRAVVLDSANNAIHGSTSSMSFTIILTALSLTISVPAAVNVTIDGKNQPQRPVTVAVTAGQYNVSVSYFAEIGNGTRLRFDHWADGFQSANRTIFVDSDVVYEAIYVTQYRLVVIRGINATGTDWYDDGEVARFSVPTTVSMSGVLGVLGGKLKFQGWYEEGKLITKLANDTMSMTEPHTITAQWQPDYTMPIAVLTPVAVIVIAFFAYFASRKARLTRGEAPSLRKEKPPARRKRTERGSGMRTRRPTRGRRV